MATPKILISDPVDFVCANYLRGHGFQVDQIKLTKEELLEKIKDYEGLIVRSETKVTADVLAAATNLKIVGRAGTGVDNVDCDKATSMGVIVMNTPGGNTMSAAEHTCALISSMSRHIPQACATLKAGAWDRKLFSGNELYGKTLAILGLGRIGREVALRMQSFGMKTIGYDPIIPAEVTREFGVESMTLEEIWPQADYITVHTPLIPQTKHLINDGVFMKCKKGVRLVNVARGGIIDEESLLRNLKSGQCGGAGLDVFVEEPPKSEYYKELLNHPKMVCTPHLGASTSEAQLRVAEEIAEQFVDFFRGIKLVGAVNAGNASDALSGPNKPWYTLAKRLGLVASLLGDNVSAFDVSVLDSSNKSTLSVNVIPSAVVAGYLGGVTKDPRLNILNAPTIAKEKGIHLSASRAPAPSGNGLKVSAKIGSTTVTIVGSLEGENGVLRSIDDSEFLGGLQLNGTQLFFKAAGGKGGFSAIEETLTKSGVTATALQRSTAGKNTWYVARVTGPVPNLTIPASGDFSTSQELTF
jgi:D-3-phosphoglycerate dehydrogenase